MVRKIFLSLLFPLIVIGGFSQDTKILDKENVYTTTSGELIFSFANINNNGSEDGSNLRFSPFFNLQNWVNFDKSEHFGWFTGLSVRNVGFIYDVPDSDVKMKYRTYNLGIPIGIKVGNLNKSFMFAGYELEFPINYKEKTFIDGDKDDKTSVWFSSRVNTLNHSIMAGVQLPYGATLKFKYYLTNFFNKDYKADDGNGGTYKPYENSDVNVFYFSLSFGLLKNADFYYSDK
jgi:hypothetical protein